MSRIQPFVFLRHFVGQRVGSGDVITVRQRNSTVRRSYVTSDCAGRDTSVTDSNTSVSNVRTESHDNGVSTSFHS